MADYSLSDLLSRAKGHRPWYSDTYIPIIQYLMEHATAISAAPGLGNIPSPIDTRWSNKTTGTGEAYELDMAGTVDSLADLGFFIVQFDRANGTGSPTLNIDGTGAKALRGSTGSPLPVGLLQNNAVALVIYDNASNQFKIATSLEETTTPTTDNFFVTGDTKSTVLQSQAGWLEMDGGTVGNSASGAKYADDGYQNLHEVVKNVFPNLGTEIWGTDVVFLPDARSRSVIGLDNMGGTSSGIIVDGWASTLGGIGGNTDVTLNVANLASHNHGINAGGSHSHSMSLKGNHSHTIPAGPVGTLVTGGGATQTLLSGSGTVTSTTGDHTHTINSGGSHGHSMSSIGESIPFNIINPSIALYWLIKV